MVKILDELPFDSNNRFTADPHFMPSLDAAIAMYSDSRRNALDTLYKSKDFTQTKSMEMQADFEEVAASCGHFSFSLLDFANEIKVYLEILDDLKLEVEERPDGRTWSWLKFWRSKRFHRARKEGNSISKCVRGQPLMNYFQIQKHCWMQIMPPTYPEICQHRLNGAPLFVCNSRNRGLKRGD